MISTFNREKDILGKNFLLTPHQRLWVEQKIVPKQKIITNHYWLRKVLKIFVDSVIFEWFIITCIIINTIVLMITWQGQPANLNHYTDLINYGFALIYTIEAALKLYAYGIKHYFSIYWNQFDFTIVVLTIISTIVTLNSTANLGAATTFLRAFKITRILRLIRKAKGLMIIFETIMITLPALANVGCLLFLFIYIYTILGIQIFAEIKLQDNLGENSNF
jgi:Ion transport protein